MKPEKIIAVRNNKTIYRDGDNCIKVFGADYSKADVLNEALNQARMEETGLNIPKISEVTVLDEKWAIVSDFIKGKTLAQLMKENPEKKTEYINTLVDLQLEIHSKKCSLLNNLYDKMKIKISQSVLDKAARDELYKRLEAMPHHDKVCHGDFNPSNIIIADDGKAYIIDWAHASQGNASADAAGTYLSFCLDGDIDGAGKYLDIFCQKSGTAKHYVQKWMPIVAAVKSVKGNEKEREFFLSCVNVTDDE
ncbi:MAG: phosphotransferase [Oscillospiraceae bacterium]|nr:phosphotransferase [Oscillospiraceae bacterium]